MTDLASWLLAQIADDEAAWQMVAARDEVLTLHGEPIAPRMLADCATKKAIVEYKPPRARSTFDDGYRRGQLNMHADILRLLAQPYADRPGFDPAWKVET